MNIQTKYNFGDIVYFTDYTTVHEAKIVGINITEDVPDEALYVLNLGSFDKRQVYERYLFTSIEEAKQSIIDSIKVLSL